METQSTKSEPAPPLAEGEGTTVAAAVTDVVRKARQDEAWAEFRDWALEGQPPITDVERAAAEREWLGLDSSR